jgi:hypothetical protein
MYGVVTLFSCAVSAGVCGERQWPEIVCWKSATGYDRVLENHRQGSHPVSKIHIKTNETRASYHMSR